MEEKNKTHEGHAAMVRLFPGEYANFKKAESALVASTALMVLVQIISSAFIVITGGFGICLFFGIFEKPVISFFLWLRAGADVMGVVAFLALVMCASKTLRVVASSLFSCAGRFVTGYLIVVAQLAVVALWGKGAIVVGWILVGIGFIPMALFGTLLNGRTDAFIACLCMLAFIGLCHLASLISKASGARYLDQIGRAHV